MNDMNIDLAKKNKEVAPESWDHLYRYLVLHGIRADVAPSMNDENAILRKALSRLLSLLTEKGVLQKSEVQSLLGEFLEYHQGVERCKSAAKEKMNHSESEVIS